MATDRLINSSQGDAIISALETMAAAQGLSISVTPARLDGDAVATITINGTAVTLYSDPHSTDFAGKQDKIPATGAANRGVYFTSSGVAAMTHELNKSVPADAVFTDTTYSPAVPNGANGLMTGADKAKLDSISLSAGGISMPVTLPSQPVANFTSAAGRPLRVTVNIEPQQAGSGDPSPSNARPITGWTEVNVTVNGGKNLLLVREGTVTKNGVTFVANRDGHVNASGTATPSQGSSAAYGTIYKVPLSSGTYKLSGCPGGGGTNSWFVRLGKDNGSSLGEYVGVDAGNGFQFSVTETAFYTVVIGIASGVAINETFSPMLSADISASFVPYTGKQITVSFGTAGTVYGGTLDVARGLLTVDKAVEHIDSTHSFYNRASDSFRVKTAFDRPPFASDVGISSILPTNPIASWASAKPNAINVYNGSTASNLSTILIKLDGVSWASDADVIAWLADHPFDYVYPLAKPLTYQLAPQQLVTLDGANNVFADCGNVTVTHWPGTGTPVEPVEDEAEIAWKKGVLDRIAALEGGS